MKRNDQTLTRFQVAIRWAGWFALGLAILNVALAGFAKWAINAPSLGAHDMGLALALAFGGAGTLFVSFIAVPVFVLLTLVAIYFYRPSALWFFIAAIMSVIPIFL